MNKFKKYGAKIFVTSLVVLLLTMFGVITDISFKLSWLNMACSFNIYIVVVLVLVYLGRTLKNKILKVIYILLVCTPFMLISVLVFLFSLSGYSGGGGYYYNKTIDEGRYKVRSYVESFDNTEETVATKIYKEIGYLPFLERLIYKTTNINEYIKNTEYNTGRIFIYRNNGNGLQWMETVNVDKL
ncbi:hypothetical protein [Dysgonomonas macrotermitis]|uniref:Uncharacterized protein n=1 Tax=Dysgonomonas macrotermitis TaxID=1346286 RepID=A0A1M5EZZ3_9BACT|nr:hypothetical protein [Dysgonomonas macrotermitis]SHF84789.1 hypothetical protein SAMN05444362_1118 [Dysgonomonas macrotermitis]